MYALVRRKSDKKLKDCNILRFRYLEREGCLMCSVTLCTVVRNTVVSSAVVGKLLVGVLVFFLQLRSRSAQQLMLMKIRS